MARTFPAEAPRPGTTGKSYVGIDNGVSGSIGIIPPSGVDAVFVKTPVFSQQNFQKTAKNITRVHATNLCNLFTQHQDLRIGPLFAVMERPLVNPGMFSATMSAVRAMESTLCVLELLQIPYMFVDSKEWQKVMLPQGCKGPDLKTASRDVGSRLFPAYRELIAKQGDADGILIAEWARRSGL